MKQESKPVNLRQNKVHIIEVFRARLEGRGETLSHNIAAFPKDFVPPKKKCSCLPKDHTRNHEGWNKSKTKPSRRMEQFRNQAITKDGTNTLSHRVILINCQAITKDGASRSKSLQKLTDNRLITSFGHAIAKIP